MNGGAYVMDNSPTTYCATCMSNCANCSNFNTCNQCDEGYFYLTQDNSMSGAMDASPTYSCSSTASDLQMDGTISTKQFSITWVIVIIAGIVAIGVATAATFYCLSKKRKNALKFCPEPSVKEEMINEMEI